MRKLKFFTYCTILATTPALLAYPQNNRSLVKFQVMNYGSHQKNGDWVRPMTYEGIMQMLDELESGELERRYSPMQLEQINNYLATLAKEGILPDEFAEEAALEEDSYDLMYGEDSAFQLVHYLENSSEFMIMPAVVNGYTSYNIIQCGKISHAWKKTKKFVKKHKKAIIIGAVVVVAAAVVVVAVVTASSAATASAAAGAAGAAAGSGSSNSSHSDSSKSESKEEPPLPITDANEAPVMKAAIDEHVSSFKEFLVEDKAVQGAISSTGWDELSFCEKAREVGSNIAHKTLDEISDLVKVVPQLRKEVEEMSSKFFPESLILSNSGNAGNPIENYENLVAKGHEAIDEAFSTDQAELFTAEAKANNPLNNFAVGMLPLPGSFNTIFSNTAHFKETGKVLDRAGFTKAGRGLMKHGNREGSVFPKPLGNPAEMNRRGQVILEEILNDPHNKVYQLKDGSLKVYSSNGRGAFFKNDGSFRGFIEQQYE